MSDIRTERRAFSRVAISLPLEIHQGGSVWPQHLIDISLGGIATTDKPETWDAQYNEPFTLSIDVGEDEPLELYAYLQNIETNRLGFIVEHVDRENIEPLRRLLAKHMDPAMLERDMALLDNL